MITSTHYMGEMKVGDKEGKKFEPTNQFFGSPEWAQKMCGHFEAEIIKNIIEYYEFSNESMDAARTQWVRDYCELYELKAKEVIFRYIDGHDYIEITDFTVKGIALLLLRCDMFYNTLSPEQKDHIIKAYIGIEMPDMDFVGQVTAH